MGHIQHTCEALSEAHTAAHHRCWRLIHEELARLASPEWRFMCITGEKNLATVWKELAEEFQPELKYMSITKDSIWNAARVREIDRPFTQAERRLREAGQSVESIAEERFWRLRPDGIAFRPQTKSKAGTFCILEFKRMSDCTDQYLTRARTKANNQYESLRRALRDTLQYQGGWQVEQISFIAGSRSLNEQDLRKNLKFFQVPEASIDSIGSKLARRIFDEDANILRCMYSVRFNRDSPGTGSSHRDPSSPVTPTPPLIRSLDTGRPDRHRKRIKKDRKGEG